MTGDTKAIHIKEVNLKDDFSDKVERRPINKSVMWVGYTCSLHEV